MPLMAKESNLYYEGCIGGKTGFATEAQHTLVTVAERDGRRYIAVTLHAADLGINCTDSIALFDYAFNNFESIDVNGRKMTVPKGVTVSDLTMETSDKNGKTLNRYYYNSQFVGYVIAADPTETPTPEPTVEVQGSAENTENIFENTEKSGSKTEMQTEQKSLTEQIQEIRTEGLSSTMKILLSIMGAMAVLLIGLLIALHIKKD